MTNLQDTPSEQATTAPPPEPVLPPALIELSPSEQEQVNALMRAPSSHPLVPPLKKDDQQTAVNAATPLLACATNQFCAEDIAPPKDMRLSQPVRIGDVQATVTLVPGKAKFRIRF